MKLNKTKCKNGNIHYYLSLSKKVNGKSTTQTYKKLGDLYSLMQEMGCTAEEVEAWCQEQKRIETELYSDARKPINIRINPEERIELDEELNFNLGYLILQSIYSKLRMDLTCSKIRKKSKIEYDLDQILRHLVYGRILFPKSKKSTFEMADHFVEKKSYELHDVYRALDVIADNLDEFQKDMFNNSQNLIERDASVIYYDCTNYYFEITQEDGKKKYGKSKENRPNPIIQMGLFMDKNGLPLAFNLFDGNKNEQQSMVPLEEKILKDYELSQFVVCTDAGLGSTANRKFNSVQNRAFVTTQSLKKLKKEELNAALSIHGWKSLKDHRPVAIESIEELKNLEEGIYYKEIPYKAGGLEQRLIITFSTKYAQYQQNIRAQQIERAAKMMEEPSKIKKTHKNPNDPRRFITQINETKDGEIAENTIVTLNQDQIDKEAMFDGLYALCTNLEDDVSQIIAVSERRWKIEQCFRIMKTEFKARPVYVQNDKRITAHFTVCVLALLVTRILELKLGEQYSITEIVDQLRYMNTTKVEGLGYIPSFKRTKLTDEMQDLVELSLDKKFIKYQTMRKIIKKSKEH